MGRTLVSLDPPPAALWIRALTPADRAAIAFSFGHLGAGARYQRFLGATRSLGARDLDRLTSVDHWHREALIAWSPVPRAPVGVAEYVRLEDFDLAEVAIAVVDAWQRQGVGQALLQALGARARAAGIRRFAVSMLRDNVGALALARQIGRCHTVASRRDVLELIVEL